jgi:hypothetical protein
MDVYLTTNEKYYSKLFRWLSKEPVSHIGLGFFRKSMGLVADCTKPFGKIYHIKQWKAKYQLKFFMRIDMSVEDELKAYKCAANHSILVRYDWGAYYYGFLMLFRRYLFGIPLPKSNSWQTKEDRICTEIMAPLMDILKKYGIDMEGVDFAAITPFELAKELKKRSEGVEGVRWYGFSDKEANVRPRYGVFPFRFLYENIIRRAHRLFQKR